MSGTVSLLCSSESGLVSLRDVLKLILVAPQIQLLACLVEDIHKVGPWSDLHFNPPEIGRDDFDMGSHHEAAADRSRRDLALDKYRVPRPPAELYRNRESCLDRVEELRGLSPINILQTKGPKSDIIVPAVRSVCVLRTA